MTSCLFNMLAWILWAGLFVRNAQCQQMFTRGQKFQIILSAKPDVTKNPLQPADAPVWDIDLFENERSVIAGLKAQGKIVVCYFSAGTWEDWRDDAKDFPESDKGKVLPEWPNEKWIRTSSIKVRDIMAKRIKIAADKGCDALDPDNTDGYQNDNGLNLKNTDLIDYMTWLQRNASAYGMKIGLKNSLDILPQLSPIMDFAVNEQCAAHYECAAYNAFLASGKPVFHIEYPARLPPTDQERGLDCGPPEGMSTVMKNLTLDGLTYYCDNSTVDTPVTGGVPRPPRPPRPSTSRTTRPTPTRTSSSRTSSSRPTPTSSSFSSTSSSSSTSRSSTSSSRPITTSSRTSSSRTSSSPRPSSTPPGGGQPGCRSAHWQQCDGQNYSGCKVCESPWTCKPVSPPWYYQCL